MAWWNCCCTEGCYAPTPEELPTVTIPGWTQVGDWEGGDCCKCIVFEPDSISWTEYCSDVFGEAYAKLECTTDYRARRVALGNLFLDTPVCPIPEDRCCPGAPFKIGEHYGLSEFWERWKLFVRWALTRIVICISKQVVDCSGTLATKWIVQSNLCIDIRAFYTKGTDTHLMEQVTDGFHACYVKDAYDDSCERDDYTTVDPPCTYDDLDPVGLADQARGSNWVKAALPAMPLCFTRVKFYDTLPTGVVTFTSSDVPAGCEWDYCNNGSNYATEFCISVASWPCGVRPCWCDAVVTLDTQVLDVSVASICTVMDCRPAGQCMGLGGRVLQTDECISFLYCCCQDGYVCDGYTRTCLDLNVTFPPITESTCCDTSMNISGDSQAPVYAMPWTMLCPYCSDYTGCIDHVPCSLPGFGCTDNATCCDIVQCDDLSYFQCSPKYELALPEQTSLTWDIDCGFSPVSYCITIPSWSVEFSYP